MENKKVLDSCCEPGEGDGIMSRTDLNKVPIVYVHLGNEPYVQEVIKISKKYNENVILLGDESNQHFCKNWMDVKTLETSEEVSFAANFFNYSLNSRDFELNCILRWFWIRRWMERSHYKEVICCDSDCCLFYDMSVLKLDEYDVGVNEDNANAEASDNQYMCSAHCAYWKYEALKDFTETVFTLYRDQVAMLAEHAKLVMDKAGNQGISDMVLLRMWLDTCEFNAVSLCKPMDQMVIDYNVNCKEDIFDFDEKYNRKKIKFIQGLPYFFIQEKPIRAIAIHCQGEAKSIIHLLYRGHYGTVSIYIFKWKVTIINGISRLYRRWMRR